MIKSKNKTQQSVMLLNDVMEWCDKKAKEQFLSRPMFIAQLLAKVMKEEIEKENK